MVLFQQSNHDIGSVEEGGGKIYYAWVHVLLAIMWTYFMVGYNCKYGYQIMNFFTTCNEID